LLNITCWEPGFIYQGDEAKLRLKSFETASFTPKVKIQFWEHGKKQPEHFICEQEMTIDQDEKEVTFETSYSINELSIYAGEGEYEVEAKIVCESMEIRSCKPEFLNVGISAVHE
jgi:hypothetical protein